MSGFNLEVDVEFPDEVLKGMEVESLLTNPLDMNVGVVVLSKFDKGSKGKLIRIYSIHKKTEDTNYKLLAELQSFLFPDAFSAKRFIKHLPQMTAIELMFMMNSQTKLDNGPQH